MKSAANRVGTTFSARTAHDVEEERHSIVAIAVDRLLTENDSGINTFKRIFRSVRQKGVTTNVD